MTGTFDYCNAGHNQPYIVKDDGAVEQTPLSGNFIVGAMENTEYSDGELQLQPGDALVMFTDGVTEAFNNENEEYGEKRLEELLSKCNNDNCKQIVDNMFNDVKAFAGTAPQSDDITSLILKRIK
jgi:sigma-B regulation protein RsbU (phosphoserine phosphatase)